MSFTYRIPGICSESLVPGEVVLFDEKYHLPELGLILLHEGIPTHLGERQTPPEQRMKTHSCARSRKHDQCSAFYSYQEFRPQCHLASDHRMNEKKVQVLLERVSVHGNTSI